MRKGKRLFTEQDIERMPENQSKNIVKSSELEEEKNEEQEKGKIKFQKFQIVNDDKHQNQGLNTIDKFLNKNTTGNIQPKQPKIVEIVVEETTISSQKQKRSSWGGIDLDAIDLNDDDNVKEQDFSHLIGRTRENLSEIIQQQAKTQKYNEPPKMPLQQPIIQQNQPIKQQNQPIKFLPTIVESIHIREELDKMDLEEEVQQDNFSAQKTKLNNQELRDNQYMIAGEYPTLNKQNIQNIIKFYGGQIITSRLKPSSYLVKGEYYRVQNINKNIEENLYVKEAIKLNCKILDFKAFEQHLKELTSNSIKESLLLAQQQEDVVEIRQSTKKEPEMQRIKIDSIDIPIFGTSKTKDKDQFQNQYSKTNEIIEGLNSNFQQQEQQQQQQQQQYNQQLNQLWSTKYAPEKVTNCVDQTHVSKIVDWLHFWGRVEPISLETKTFQAYNISAKALLLSGPPGIGKTTIIRKIAQQMNYQLIEWNASDVRSKSQIENYVRHLQDNQVLKFNNEKLVNEKMTIILMDEVDGMSGSDKGGNKCLIDMIKLTKQPIVCICNDRNNAKMRSLSLHCLDLQFKKPNIDEVQKRLEQICKAEKLSYNVKELRQLIEFSQCDLRQLLNTLQMHQIGLKTHLSEQAHKDSSVTTNIFEAGKTLLSYKNASTMSIYQLMELYFIDPDILQLMYHENYLDTKFQNQDSQTTIQKIAMASQSISEADVLNTRIKRNNEWSLMPNVGFYSCVYPTQKMQGNFFAKVNFPQFLGKISSQNKCKRQLLELKDNFGQQTYLSSVKQIKFQLIEPLAFIAIRQLQIDGVKSFENVHNLLKNYNLNIASFEECLLKCLSLFPKRDIYQIIVEDSVRTQFAKYCKKTMDSAEQMESGGSRRQFQGERTQKYNELEDEVAEEEEEEEDNQKKKKKVTTMKQVKTKKQQNKNAKNAKKPAGGKKKK